MEVSHEVPLWLLHESRSFNDYDYALVHLFEKFPEYEQFFMESLAMNRKVILDNSLYELDKPFDGDVYAEAILKLKPTLFIAPDKFGDVNFTVSSARDWKSFSKSEKRPMMAVVQGSTLEDMVHCYNLLNKEINPDVMAISFGSPAYINEFPGIDKDLARVYGRIKLISILEKRGTINRKKPHHLLGLSLPIELPFYRDRTYIQSIDTSSPIVAGYEGAHYEAFGLAKKSELKLAEIMGDQEKNREIILSNIRAFREIL